ncbi:hypothetical protein R54767_05001 [Paraburkholderia gardini]|uniref:GST N-terminal domain-containing protein n=1 Tax=Paraburkholderia gardini TaxID=2823469 RepID=A0ABM8UB12_9BURK|nr:hypothetical protein R54767_05001 [Paraburkholderia gardini]
MANTTGNAGTTLTISSKNYSSWSLRGWLLAKLSGLPFEETVMPIDDPGARAIRYRTDRHDLARVSRAIRRPVSVRRKADSRRRDVRAGRDTLRHLRREARSGHRCVRAGNTRAARDAGMDRRRAERSRGNRRTGRRVPGRVSALAGACEAACATSRFVHSTITAFITLFLHGDNQIGVLRQMAV